MRTRTKLAVAMLIACVGLMLPVVASAAGTVWTAMPTPGTASVDLTSVSCPSLSFCLAPGGYPGEEVVLEWNGSTWAYLTAFYENLNAISCASPTYCIIVGNNFDPHPRGSTTFAALWNGKSFSTMDTFNPATRWNGFQTIKCLSSTSCEAAGYQSNYEGPSGRPLFEYWNGTTWTAQPAANPPKGSVRLSAIACSSISRCEAVGSRALPHNSAVTAFAWGWSGTKWTNQPMPSTANAGGLDAVSCYGTGCTAVGENGSTLTHSWNGTTWALQSQLGSDAWTGVHCQSSSNCTAVGYSVGVDAPVASTWNGSTWTQDTTPVVNGGFRAVSCTSHGSICTAVGFQQSGALAARN